ncbi:MAG TPA: monofunctional biosynthetic peptidoglycan transglycosylase [Sulfuricurvum sp.]|nr:MAG: monofunctional biosynthetic peptidoglycan transglycosylase [Campylobacterales bacterium 16-40-21]OZA03007.1 MAG: monofunctional biosynthetic peptidoglycan transglycosylase [Sulfuricurvum sp. 17-40-25]HQS66910.1 monofunctional biosynthetic peptidoglycan transglycosylase [Sulfuricurvum sp.]HQT35648.1 monofunctional biosynthetic peptidoglycan transglycosylase [Sulfuricurvum sp.]
MKKIWKITLILLLLGAVDIARYFVYPDINALKEIRPVPTAFMQYRQDEWAAENRDMQITQKWVNMSNISPNIIKAVLIGEDDGFWKHDGFDVKGMENAIERSIKKGTLAGGSTISQQLSKNLYLSPSKNPVRKIKEAIITWRIEKTLSKRRILEIYLNVAEWGDGIFGIEAAARHYYHKSAKNLTAKEASRLAAVLPNPIRYNPTGNQKYVKNRSRIILKIMKRRGVIQSIYKEVMTIPKADTTDSSETNTSLDSLFNIHDDAPVSLPSEENEQVPSESSNLEANAS